MINQDTAFNVLFSSAPSVAWESSPYKTPIVNSEKLKFQKFPEQILLSRDEIPTEYKRLNIDNRIEKLYPGQVLSVNDTEMVLSLFKALEIADVILGVDDKKIHTAYITEEDANKVELYNQEPSSSINKKQAEEVAALNQQIKALHSECDKYRSEKEQAQNQFLDAYAQAKTTLAKLMQMQGLLKEATTTLSAYHKETKENLECPLLLEPMEDPVIAVDGFTYERSAIEAWLASHNTSPMTNATLAHKELIPNRLAKKFTELAAKY